MYNHDVHQSLNKHILTPNLYIHMDSCLKARKCNFELKQNKYITHTWGRNCSSMGKTTQNKTKQNKNTR